MCDLMSEGCIYFMYSWRVCVLYWIVLIAWHFVSVFCAHVVLYFSFILGWSCAIVDVGWKENVYVLVADSLLVGEECW